MKECPIFKFKLRGFYSIAAAMGFLIVISILIGCNKDKKKKIQRGQNLADADIEVVPVNPSSRNNNQGGSTAPIPAGKRNWTSLFVCVNQKKHDEEDENEFIDDYTHECEDKIKERLKTGYYDVAIFTTVKKNPDSYPWNNAGTAYLPNGAEEELDNISSVISFPHIKLVHSFYGGHASFLTSSINLKNVRSLLEVAPNAIDVRHTHNSCKSYPEDERARVENSFKRIAKNGKTIVMCGNQFITMWGCSCAAGVCEPEGQGLVNAGNQTLQCTYSQNMKVQSVSAGGTSWSKYANKRCVFDDEADYYIGTYLWLNEKGPAGEDCLVCGYQIKDNKPAWVNAAHYGQICDGKYKPDPTKW